MGKAWVSCEVDDVLYLTMDNEMEDDLYDYIIHSGNCKSLFSTEDDERFRGNDCA